MINQIDIWMSLLLGMKVDQIEDICPILERLEGAISCKADSVLTVGFSRVLQLFKDARGFWDLLISKFIAGPRTIHHERNTYFNNSSAIIELLKKEMPED